MKKPGCFKAMGPLIRAMTQTLSDAGAKTKGGGPPDCDSCGRAVQKPESLFNDFMFKACTRCEKFSRRLPTCQRSSAWPDSNEGQPKLMQCLVIYAGKVCGGGGGGGSGWDNTCTKVMLVNATQYSQFQRWSTTR